MNTRGTYNCAFNQLLRTHAAAAMLYHHSTKYAIKRAKNVKMYTE